MRIHHQGREQFLRGVLGSGGDNLFVDAHGVMRRITDNDLNGNGRFDIVLPNSHGYIERAPTTVYGWDGGAWHGTDLPHDSGWVPRAADVDGDGYLDLIVVNGENGVTSELPSYVYWGGPEGLSGERTILDTVGAYDVAVCDLDGSGRNALLFSTAWQDHHNPGTPLHQRIFLQSEPRRFTDATDRYACRGLATTSLVCEDLTGDGYPDLVLANYREQYNHDTDSFLYPGTANGFDTAHPVRLPTHYALQVIATDLNGDGFKELVFTGGNQVRIYWNDAGGFRADNRLVLLTFAGAAQPRATAGQTRHLPHRGIGCLDRAGRLRNAHHGHVGQMRTVQGVRHRHGRAGLGTAPPAAEVSGIMFEERRIDHEAGSFRVSSVVSNTFGYVVSHGTRGGRASKVGSP